MSSAVTLTDFAPAIMGLVVGVAGLAAAFFASTGTRALARQRRSAGAPLTVIESVVNIVDPFVANVEAPVDLRQSDTLAAPALPQVKVGLARSAPEAVTQPRISPIGTVKFFNADRGYGFITEETGPTGVPQDLMRMRKRIIGLLKARAVGAAPVRYIDYAFSGGIEASSLQGLEATLKAQ